MSVAVRALASAGCAGGMAAPGKLRVLCLHGYGQGGEAFRAKSGPAPPQPASATCLRNNRRPHRYHNPLTHHVPFATGALRKTVKSLVDWTFITSPHVLPAAGGGAGHPTHAADPGAALDGRYWWDFEQEANKSVGWDASVQFIIDAFEEQVRARSTSAGGERRAGS